MYLFIDLETTGLPRGRIQPRIVSMAWELAGGPGDRGRIRSMLIRPFGFLIPPEAARIHGITTSQAKRDGVSLQSALHLLAADVEEQRPVIVVAHNLGFDWAVLEAECTLSGVPFPLAGLQKICTMHLARKVWPGESAALSAVSERLFGTPNIDAHNADADVRACAKVFFKLWPGAPHSLHQSGLDYAGSHFA